MYLEVHPAFFLLRYSLLNITVHVPVSALKKKRGVRGGEFLLRNLQGHQMGSTIN